MFWNKYPYSDFHELNLDWILAQIKKMHADWDEFKAINTITNAGAWDITRSYQIWTIVSDNNAGYISLKPVPAGIAISNTEYWGLIADYDILITNLSDRISDLETAVNDIDTLLGKTLNKRRFIVIADSYGEVVDSDGKNFAKAAFDLLGVPSSRYQIKAKGGTGFKAVYDGQSFLTLLQSADTTDASIVTDIFVWGGANDISYSTSDIKAKINEFIAYAKTTFPNAKVQIGHPGTTWNTGTGRLNREANSLNAYRNAGESGASYIANSEYILDRSDLMADGDTAHPNPNGVAEMTQQFIEAINTGACDVHYRTTAPFELAYTTNGTFAYEALAVRIDNGEVSVEFQAGGDFMSISGGTVSNPVSCPTASGSGTFVKTPVSFFAAINAGANAYTGIPVHLMYLSADDNKWYTGRGVLYPSAYDTTTHYVTYGLNVFNDYNIRNIAHVAKIGIKLPEVARVI